jgi:hypothetical protein
MNPKRRFIEAGSAPALPESRRIAFSTTADRRRDVLQLGRPQRLALSDAVPFRKTTPAARRRGVLRDEYRMSPERRLLAVVSRACRA